MLGFGAFVRAARACLLCCALALVSLSAVGETGDSTGTGGHYFLVIDHSGSMLTPITQGSEVGKTRWELLRERAAGFVDRLPLGSEAWAIVFSATDPATPARDWKRTFAARLASDTDRERLAVSLRTFALPSQANGTWLRQAVHLALDQVEIAGTRDPDAYLTVLVYTDGVDQGHGRTGAEMARSPGSAVTQSALDRRIREFRRKFRNFNVVNVYRPGDETVLDAQVVRLLTNRVQLANPLVVSRQDLTLEMSYRDTSALKLSGRPFSLTLEGDDGRRLPLKVEGGPFRMQTAPLPLSVNRDGDWPAGQDVQARLRIKYPEVDGIFLVAEGGDTVELSIQGAEAPGIRDLLPTEGSAFPVGRDVSFSLTTLASARVRWDFGDGSQAEGPTATHRYTEPGRKTVTVKVTDPRSGLTNSQSLNIESVRLSVTLDPFPGRVDPDREVTLTASAEGAFSRFRWNVGGQVYAGAVLPNGGSALTLTFDRPGQVPVSVIGEGTRGGSAESAQATLQVREVPQLRVTSPASGDTFYFGALRELSAEVEGVRASRVRFTLLGGDGSELAPAREVDVQQQGDVRLAVLRIEVPQLRGRIPARLRVETMDVEPDNLVREISITLEREPTTLQVLLPEGPEPYHGRSTPLRLEANAPLTDIQWDFGDGRGWVAGSEVQRQAWQEYGAYTVRAVARDPEGNQVESGPVAVTVPVRPVAVEALLILDGESVGGDAGKVSLNSTLELRANEQGDVKRLRWFLDGEELPEGQKTITVTDRGQHQLELRVEGTPEAGEARSVITFRASDPLVFWALLAVLLVLTWILGKLLLRNGRRCTVFTVQREWINASSRTIANFPWQASKNERVAGTWNWWKKRADLDPNKLDNGRSDELEAAWKGDERKLRFIRKSLSSCELKFVDAQSSNDKVVYWNDAESSSRYDFLWQVERELSKCNLSESEHEENKNLILCAESGHKWYSFWPELLFIGYAVLLVIGIRELWALLL